MAILSVITVAVLSLLSGIVVWVGSYRHRKDHAIWFVILAFVVAAWSGCIAGLLGFAEKQDLRLPLSYIVYALSVVIVVALAAYLIRLLILFKHERSKRRRQRLLAAIFGVMVLDVVVAIFSLVVPRFVSAEWLVVAPVTMSIGLAVFYYAVLKYRVIWIESKWLRVLAYLVIIALAAMIYMMAFYVIFTYIFKIENLPGSVFVLNYVMICVVLLLFPVMNELVDFTTGLIRANQVNLPYIIKKLNKMAADMDLSDLATFLADNLHFDYVGFEMNGKMIGSLRRGPRMSELSVVSEMKDAGGAVFGKMLVGKPLGKDKLEHKDLAELKMIANLVAALIDSKAEVKE